MKTKINICEREWCNLVFEGKNKSYGAFAIRVHADEQKIKALFITISLAVAIAIYPLITGKSIIDIVKPINDAPTVFAPVTNPPSDIPKPPTPEKPAPRNASIAFTQPTITDAEEPTDPPKQADLFSSKRNISFVTDDADKADLTYLKDLGATGDGKKNEVFKAVEKMPQFPGGSEALVNFIRKNLRYPEISQYNNIQGKVYAQFIVDKTGKITDLKIVRGLDESCNEETLRIMNLMPDWTPGMQNGRTVAVFFTLPVAFELIIR